jgi:Immunity protein 21
VTWFANDGGPLLAIDAQAAADWTGTGEDTTTGIPPGSDYDRACHVDYPAGILPAGSSSAVVIGAQENVGAARWLQGADPTVVFLVGAVFGDETTDLALFEQLLRGHGFEWVHLGELTVPSGRLALFHAACSGADVTLDPLREPALIGDAITQPVLPGRYRLSAAEARFDDHALYCIVRWLLKA